MHRVYYVCMCVCKDKYKIHMRMYVRTYIHSIWAYMQVKICMYVCIRVYYVCMYVSMYGCMFVCTFEYIYIYIYTYALIEIIILGENCPGEYVLLETGGEVSRWNLSGGKVSLGSVQWESVRSPNLSGMIGLRKSIMVKMGGN